MKKLWAPVLLLLILSVKAEADVLATSYRQNFPTNVTTTPTFLPLNDAGATSLAFSTTATGTVVVTYNGDCSSANPGAAIVAVAIYIDGVAAPPTTSSYSRVCADGPYAAHSRSVTATVGPGAHTVQVLGVIIGSGTGAFLRTITTVMN